MIDGVCTFVPTTQNLNIMVHEQGTPAPTPIEPIVEEQRVKQIVVKKIDKTEVLNLGVGLDVTEQNGVLKLDVE